MESGAGSPDHYCRSMKQSPRQRSRLREKAMTLDQLDSWLKALEPAPKVDGMSMLDGYLTAVVIGPCSIPPDEWLVDLLGERGRIATAAGKRLNAITAIAARVNVISEGLSLAPTQQARIFERMEDVMVLPQLWCTGFLAAMQLRMPEWRPLLDLGRID